MSIPRTRLWFESHPHRQNLFQLPQGKRVAPAPPEIQFSACAACLSPDRISVTSFRIPETEMGFAT